MRKGGASLTKYLSKNYTKCIKNLQTPKFVNTFYTKIVQIKIVYHNECAKNVHQIPT